MRQRFMESSSGKCNAAFAEKFVLDFYIRNKNPQLSISYLYDIPFVRVCARARVCFWVALKYCPNSSSKFHYVQLGGK